uniref:8 kDa glycoprotein n=1 Tax=Echinococcus granulosus TaxID=6210 RepID=B6E483_ECHGR|nr:8 kDa glycoprotein [Echinococcus granulosus]
MRVYIVLLALTVYVVAVLAERDKPEDDGKSNKKWIEFIRNFFYGNPIGKQIAELAKNWNEAAPEGRCKVQALLAENFGGLKKKTA